MLPILAKIATTLTAIGIIKDLMPNKKEKVDTGGLNREQFQIAVHSFAQCQNDNKAGKLPKVTMYGFCKGINNRFGTTLTPLVMRRMWAGQITEHDL